MKIRYGLLIILLFQVVQRVNAGYFSESSKNDEESTFRDNVWSTFVDGTSWLAKEVKDGAKILATKAKSILKWKGTSEGIPNDKDSSSGFFKDSWSYSYDKVKGIYSATFTSKASDAEAFTTGGFLKDSWSYFHDKVNGFYSAIFTPKASDATGGFFKDSCSYFYDSVKGFYGAIFSGEASDVGGFITDDDSQSQDTSFEGYIKLFWFSCIGWFKSPPGEECTAEWTPGNTSDLEQELKELLYGQHLVTRHVSHMIDFHWGQANPKKALVLSLHGSTGVGKNYVASLIVRNLFKLGEKSKFVTVYSGRANFTQEKKLELYQEQLKDDLVKKVTLCERHVFIFDEVDKIPMGILDVLKPFIDYNIKVLDCDFRKTIFIFMSNMGQNEITQHYMHLWNDGIKRADIKYSDFEKVLKDGVYNDDGGLHYSVNIKSHLIDLYIPFLPLEEEHVKRCIKFAFMKYCDIEPTEEEIEAVHGFVDYWPQHNPIFAKTGCKTLISKVALIASYRTKRQDL